VSSSPSYQFRSDEYDRPSQAWACGEDAQGTPCPLGPTQLGVCQAECTPRKEGDRFYCNHASQLAGNCDEGPQPDGLCCQMPPQCEPSKQAGAWTCNRGKCHEGPLPDGSCSRQFHTCRPVRGTLAMRRLAVLAVLGLAIGSVLLMTGASSRLAVISPGKLTKHHQGTEGCRDCHSVGEGQLLDWIHAAFSPSSEPSQTQLCLQCHTDLGENAAFAHGLAPEELPRRRERVSLSSADSLTLKAARKVQPAEHQELACRTCHGEHHGEGFDMKQMANRECQVCHRETFDSFHHGHPELTDFFYQRRTRLHFNHASHVNVHFSNFERTLREGSEASTWAGSAPDCTDCHFPDATGQSILTRGYEASCANCHEHQIADDASQPITILRFPLAVTDEGESTITMPSENGSTPFMRLLLPKGWDHASVTDPPIPSSEGGDSHLAMQQLLEEMLYQDHLGLEHRLRQSLGSDEAAIDLSVLAKSLTRVDFPRYERQRILAFIASESVDDKNAREEGNVEQTTSASRSSWNLDRRSDSITISYRPAGHADPFLKAWLEAGARHTKATAFRQKNSEDSPLSSVFRQLTSSTLAGRCLKCHTVGEAIDGQLQIEWLSDRNAGSDHQFTKFDHASHLKLGRKTSCRTCHLVDSESEIVFFKPQFVHRDNTINTSAQATEASGFHPVEKASCSKCHQSTAAGDSCLMCHQYHIHVHGLQGRSQGK